MSWRIGDDELALVGGEKAIGHVDRDALLPFSGQSVNEQGKVDILTLSSHFLGVAFERCQLVLEDHLCVIEQATDQGRLSVVHGSTGDEAKQGFMLMLLQIGGDI